MQIVIVNCHKCGTKNRLKERVGSGAYRCGKGKCSNEIPSPFLYVVVDCETTGLPSQRSNPFLVQLAWSVHDPSGVAVEEHCCIVKPDGYEIPRASTNVHGISHQLASLWGLDLKQVLSDFAVALGKPNVRLIAHNLDFDTRVLGAEFTRLGIESPLSALPTYCTMQSTVDLCNLPNRGSGYKWPSLQALHLHLFGKGFPDGHTALNDVRAAARCFFRLGAKDFVSFD